MSTETATNCSHSLAQRMTQGRLPVHEALRYALILAEALRKIHDSGHVHGAVSPGCISLNRSGLELMPALGSTGEVTPYTAPEVVHGAAPDSRADIFSFGAIVYEMLAGRPAFKGDSPEALTDAITDSAPAPSGSPAVDRLVASCLAKDPAARLQRVQKLILELKLLAVSVRRVEAAQGRQPDAVLREDLQQLDVRLSATLGRLEKATADMAERTSEIEDALRDGAVQKVDADRRMAEVEQTLRSGAERFEALDRRAMGIEQTLTAADARFDTFDVRTAALEQALKPVGDHLETFGQRISAIEQALKTAGDYIERLERGIESVRQDSVALSDRISEELQMFEKVLKTHEASIESSRTAIAQTDDLVERVVEALESLQSVVLEHSDDRAVAAN